MKVIIHYTRYVQILHRFRAGTITVYIQVRLGLMAAANSSKQAAAKIPYPVENVRGLTNVATVLRPTNSERELWSSGLAV